MHFIFRLRLPILEVGLLLLVQYIGGISTGQSESLELNVDCGNVPVYKDVLGKSFNESEHARTVAKRGDIDGDLRILHGLSAIRGEWPWVVRMMNCKGDNCATCTGSLVSSRWVLSAGHCGQNIDPADLEFTFGLYDLVTADQGSFSVKVDHIYVHPEYQNLENDVALFRLEKPIDFSPTVQPVCLLSSATKDLRSYANGKACYVIGYGMTEGANFAIKLQKLVIEPRTPDQCNSDHLNGVELRKGGVCIGPHNEDLAGSSCHGDSGGPNVCFDEETGRWHVFGLVSYGPGECDREAGDKWLSVAADLTNFRSWIIETIAAHDAD